MSNSTVTPGNDSLETVTEQNGLYSIDFTYSGAFYLVAQVVNLFPDLKSHCARVIGYKLYRDNNCDANLLTASNTLTANATMTSIESPSSENGNYFSFEIF